MEAKEEEVAEEEVEWESQGKAIDEVEDADVLQGHNSQ